MLFHVGAILRLNELGLLARVERFSSVSGGSITAGLLARRWHELTFANGTTTNLEPLVVKPLRELARHRIDVPAWDYRHDPAGLDACRRFADVLDEHLYDGWLFRPGFPDTPRFVINATNIGTGSLFRFSRPYQARLSPQAESRPGRASSSGSRCVLCVPALLLAAPVPIWRMRHRSPTRATFPAEELATLRRRPALGDGGMYDNLGLNRLEPVRDRVRERWRAPSHASRRRGFLGGLSA